MPTGNRIVLNQAIVIARILNEEGLNLALIREGRACIAAVGMINSQSPDYQKYLKLIEHWERLELRFGTKDKVNL